MQDRHRLDLDRYLVPFTLRQVPQYRYDVVVLGSGAAGAVTALSAAAKIGNSSNKLIFPSHNDTLLDNIIFFLKFNLP